MYVYMCMYVYMYVYVYMYMCFPFKFFINISRVDKIDFVRDVSVYMLVVGLVIGVAYDGKVS